MDDVKGAVEDFIQQKPDVTCLKDEPWFIKQAVLSKEFPCPETPDLNCGTCDGKKFQMMKELWPNKDSVYVERKYGVYDKDFGTVVGNNNSIFTLLCGNDPDPRKWKLQIGGEQLTLNADVPGGSGLYVVGPGSFGPAVVAGSGFVLSGSDTLRCRYRYQDECLVQLPASVTRFGHTYTQLRTLPVDTFIAIFSDSIAEALLPLHPEYCQLLACVKDNYQRKLSAIPDAEVADQLHLFRLRDMILADPIYAKMQLQPARYPSPYDTLAFSSQGRISLDTLALLRAYCQCRDSFMMVDCYNNLFGQQIQNGILNDPYARAQYYKLVRSLYLTNRERYKPLLSGTGDCSTCQPIRMRLSPPPVFPESVAAGGQPAFGSGIMLGMGGTGSGFQSQVAEYYHLLQIANPDSMASFVDSTHTYTFNQLSDSAFTVYNSYNNSLCSGAVDQIIAQLVNCVLPPANLDNVRTSLMQLCSSGQVQQGFYTPAQIRWALTSNGIALGDLCNPYLVNYDNNMNFSQQGPGNFRCSNEGFYADISATLGQAAVLDALGQPGTSSSLTLNNLNSFQQGLIQALGAASCTVTAAYSASAHLYTLRFINGGNEVKVYFRTAESGACSAAFTKNPGETLSVSVSCINNSPFSQFASGLVGQYTFATTVTHTSGSTVTQCMLPSWNNKIAINSTGANPLAGTVPCTQLRDLYRDFSDTLKAYQIKGTDHPYYGTVLRNFMNYKLKKAYSLDQYQDVIAGCSLADSIQLDRYRVYALMQFYNSTDAATFVNSLNALDSAVTLTPMRWENFATNVEIDFNQIPLSKLAKFKNFIDNYNATPLINKYTNKTHIEFCIEQGIPNILGLIFQRGTSNLFGATFGNFSFALMGTFNIWNGMNYEQGKLYSVTTTTPNDHAANNYNAYLLKRYFPDNNMPAVYYPNIQSTVNGEYLLPEKQAFLNYTYNKQGQPATAVLDTILPQPLRAGVGLFSNKMLSYGYPAQPGRIEHLYVADPATATAGTRYPMLEYILDKVKNQLSGRILFSGAAARNITVPAGEQLTAYRCRDTAFWYRYFGQGDTLFNVFVSIPDYIDTSYFNQYVVTGLTFNPGEGDSRSFKVTLESNVNPPLPKLELNGYTDFVVARNKVLHNVLLAHAVNESIPLGDTINNCERLRLKAAIYEGKVRYRQYINSIRNKLTGDFYAYIMGSGIQEKLKVGYRNQRFNYTLYYYDRAGNLMRTVPPAGVAMLNGASLNGVDGARTSFNSSWQYLPEHLKPSDYKYNTLNQVVQQNTPDGGRTAYFYDAAGRAIFSQNAKQRETGKMTYTLYDKQGRIMETGQAIMACVPYFEPYSSPTGLNSNPCSHYIAGVVTPFPDVVQELQQRSHDEVIAYVRSLSREEVVLTHYDFAALHLQGAAAGLSAQENLRKRVACIKYFDNLEPSDATFEKYRYALHFSYDIAGNVKTLTRDYPFWKTEHQQFKRIDYDYDVISGKVNMLSYNRGFADQYYQRYRYDGDNRIIKVETSADGYIWKRDAEYQYYQHGPLARTSLGDLRVQGVDYAYTIQGWLKAVNGDVLSPDGDMGKDAAANSIHAADVMALSLDYFKGDYRPVGATPVVQLGQPERSLYNGNIPRATTNLQPFPALNTEYRYDQLNRITKAGYAYINPYDRQLSRTSDYSSSYAYDPDGNLQRLVRNGNAVGGQSQLMDSLSYHYQPGGTNNRLQNITDVISNNSFHNDIKHYTNSGASRYLYDATGNTIKDQVSGQDSILWSHYNKVSSTRRDSLGNSLNFAYDGAGNRYLKTVVRSSGDTTLERSDYYVRDAQGNILAVYDAESNYTMSTRQWVEYITTRLYTSLEPYLRVVIGPHYALEGHFRDAVLKRVQENSTYMQLLSKDWPVSFYVTHNKAIKSNILNFAGNYPDFYQQLGLFAKSTEQPLLAAALYNDLYRNDELNTAFLQQLLSQAGEGTIRPYTLELLCRTADTMMQAQFKELDLAYTADPRANAKTLDDRLKARPELIGGVSAALNKKIVDYGFGDQYWSFLQSFSTDATVLSSPVYFDTKNKALLVEFCQRAMQRHASDSVLGAYFDTWAPARGAMLETSNPQTLLQVVYNADPAGFLQHYIVNGAGGDLSITYDALARVPWIRPWDYAELWRPVVVTDSIIHTVYEEVVRLRRISLSEHHLYGSSRLGLKKYLPGQYYLNWDNSGPQPVADTVTLNARSPWYSLEYNDDITALVQQPWNQTETAPFLAGHSVGQKQYELSNHLGNVQATVSDYPYMHPVGEGDSIRMRSAAIVSAYDYYPFGMLMPGRGTDSMNAISNVMGNTLLVYNDFNDGSTQGWYIYNGGTSVSNENGKLKMVADNKWQGGQKYMPVIPGKQYRVRFNLELGSATGISIGIYSAGYLAQQYETTGGLQDYTFTAPGNTVAVMVQTNYWHWPGATYTFYMDNFTLEEVKPQQETPPVTGNGCMTMTQSKWVTTWVDSCYYPFTWQWPIYRAERYDGQPILTTAKKTETAIELNIAGGEAAAFTLSAIPGMAQSVTLDFETVQGNTQLLVQEEQGGTWSNIASATATVKGNYILNFTPTQGQVKLKIVGAVFVGLRKICVKKPVMKQENVLVDVCPADKDKYRFGFNGQEKVNEWAGIGNFMEFSERGHDTRAARFITYDPLAKQYPWNSPYAFAENRPIDGKDLEGREWYRAVGNWLYGNTLVGLVDNTSQTIKAATKGDKHAQLSLISSGLATGVEGAEVLKHGTSVQKEEYATTLILNIATMFAVPAIESYWGGRSGSSLVQRNSAAITEKPLVATAVVGESKLVSEPLQRMESKITTEAASSGKPSKTTARMGLAENTFKEAGKSDGQVRNLMKTINFAKAVKESTLKVGDKIWRFERVNYPSGEKHFFTDAYGADAGPQGVGFSDAFTYELKAYEVTTETKVLESTIRGTGQKQYFSTELQNNIKPVAETQ